MEIISANEIYACDYEVMQLLRGVKDKARNKRIGEQLATITYQALRYLERAPCANQSEESIRAFGKAVKEKYTLTKKELLNILNLLPSTPVELQLIIENSQQERLSEEDEQGILQLIKTTFPASRKSGQKDKLAPSTSGLGQK